MSNPADQLATIGRSIEAAVTEMIGGDHIGDVLAIARGYPHQPDPGTVAREVVQSFRDFVWRDELITAAAILARIGLPPSLMAPLGPECTGLVFALAEVIANGDVRNLAQVVAAVCPRGWDSIGDPPPETLTFGKDGLPVSVPVYMRHWIAVSADEAVVLRPRLKAKFGIPDFDENFDDLPAGFFDQEAEAVARD
jgi:hypothetical protein